MKRLTQFAPAVWVLNFWLVYMYMVNPAAYEALRLAGAQWYSCIEWDAAGSAQASQACELPAPADPF